MATEHSLAKAEKTDIQRYNPHESYIRLYDAYKSERRIAQSDKLTIDEYHFSVEHREKAKKKCIRLR